MRVAIISDIHSNLEALTAVVADLRERKPDRIWCLGDIAGYNADPDRCCEIVRDLCHVTVMGNHDGAVTEYVEPSHFNRVAKEAVMWDRRVMKRGNVEFLKSLRSAAAIDEEVLLVHGSPSDPDKYILAGKIAKEEIEFMKKNLKREIGFFGHTHFPVVYELTGNGTFNTHLGKGTIQLRKGFFHLINPGSVGQPRDGDPRASFVLFNREKREVEFIRIEYDIKSCQEKIISAGLPPFLADRLSHGY